MDRPGEFQLGLNGNAFAIAGSGTFVGDWQYGLEGIRSLSLQANFKCGGGGASVTLYVQTSLDQGQTPIDVWAQQFTTSSGTEIVNLDDSAVTTPVAPQNQGLTPGTCVNGILGDRFRAVVVVTGNYTGSSLLNVTGVAR